MLYRVVINQLGITKYGLEKKTDVIDWAIIYYLYKLQNFNTEIGFTDTCQLKSKLFFKLNYKMLIENMHVLNIINKTAISYRISKLKKLKLIETIQAKDNTLYFCLTDLSMDILLTQ